MAIKYVPNKIRNKKVKKEITFNKQNSYKNSYKIESCDFVCNNITI